MGRSCEYDETVQIITVYYSGKMWEDHVRWSTWSSKRIDSQLGNRLHLFGNKDKRVVCIMVHVQFDVSSCIVASNFPQIPVRVRQSSVASLPLNLNLFALHFPCECRQPPRHVEQNIAKHSCPRDWQTTNSNRWIRWTTLNIDWVLNKGILCSHACRCMPRGPQKLPSLHHLSDFFIVDTRFTKNHAWPVKTSMVFHDQRNSSTVLSHSNKP